MIDDDISRRLTARTAASRNAPTSWASEPDFTRLWLLLEILQPVAIRFSH
jgi:hypothetical protein